MQPRPYQTATVDAVVDAWSAGDHSVCAALPTGTGKTVIAGLLAQRLRDEVGGRTGIVTDRLPLLESGRARMHELGLRTARIQGGRTSSQSELDAADVLLISSQTADSRGLTPDGLGLLAVVIDECHLDRAVTRRWLQTGTPTMGLSATPLARWMTDGDGNGGAWWRRLYAPLTTRAAIDAGWLLDPWFLAELPDPATTEEGREVGRQGEDWSASEAEALAIPYLDATVDAWESVVGRPTSEGGFDGHAPQTIVQGCTIDHCQSLAARFSARTGEQWISVSGEDLAETEDAISAFRDGDVRGLLSVTKLALGFDAPEAACLVSTRATRRLITWAQLVGRLMRVPAAGARVVGATVVDCAGNAHRLAGRLHQFWSRGPQWPLSESSGLPSTGAGAPPEALQGATCEDHPTIVQSPSAQVCRVCYRPLKQREAPTARAWKDAVTVDDLGRSIRLLAAARLRWAPDPAAAQKWARRQVHTLTGRWPGPGWPALEIDPFAVSAPHPVVERLVKRNGAAYRAWLDSDPATRPEHAPSEQVTMR